MAFVRQRGNSHQLIETYREGGTVKQRILANLGHHVSLAAAIAAEPERFRHLDAGAPPSDTTHVVSKPQPTQPTDAPSEQELERKRLYNAPGRPRMEERIAATMRDKQLSRKDAVDLIFTAERNAARQLRATMKLPPEQEQRVEAAMRRKRLQRWEAVDQIRAEDTARAAAKRTEVMQALLPLIPLGSLVNGPQKRGAIEDAFGGFDKDEDVPSGIDHGQLVRGVVAVKDWLPELVGILAPNRGKRLSRAARWAEAKAEASAALQELVDLKQEFADWRGKLDDLPSGLQDSGPTQALIDKLDAFEEVDLDTAIDAIESIEDPDFPRGFGKD